MEKGKDKKRKKKSGRIIFAALISVFVIAGGIALYNIITREASYSAARQEYVELRQLAPTPAPAPMPENPPTTEVGPNNESQEPEESSNDIADLSDINPDYIGWIRIDGTGIDYPVVQGADNYRYMGITFMGERNSSGAIFMDIRCANRFEGFSILYGHNMRDGSMFSELHSYRDAAFIDAHPEIQIFKPDGGVWIFRIFDVKLTNVQDTVFTLPGSSQDAVVEYFSGHGIMESADILVLSTCTTGNRDDERLLVFAERWGE